MRGIVAEFRRLDVYRKLTDSAQDEGVVRDSRAGAYLSLATLAVMLCVRSESIQGTALSYDGSGGDVNCND
jgi:hypothetical protein